jgi:hypothetical protein
MTTVGTQTTPFMVTTCTQTDLAPKCQYTKAEKMKYQKKLQKARYKANKKARKAEAHSAIIPLQVMPELQSHLSNIPKVLASVATSSSTANLPAQKTIPIILPLVEPQVPASLVDTVLPPMVRGLNLIPMPKQLDTSTNKSEANLIISDITIPPMSFLAKCSQQRRQLRAQQVWHGNHTRNCGNKQPKVHGVSPY